MQPLKQQMREYRDIQAWLAGEKPPARGRTWRRRIREHLPRPVQTAVLAVAPRGPGLLLRTLCIVAFAHVSMILPDLLLPSNQVGPVQMDNIIQMLNDVLRPIVMWASVAFMGFIGLAMCLGRPD